MNRPCILAVLASLCLVQTSRAANIEIPAQALAPALHAFGKQTDLLIIFVSEDVQTLQSSRVAGDLKPDEALKQLLKGTGLTYQYVDEQTVSILPVKPAGSTVASKPVPGEKPTVVDQATVTAPREPEEIQLDGRARPAISEFIGHHGALTPRTGKVARWSTGICPVILGLSDPLKVYVSRRILQVAARAGVPPQTNPRCRPNVEVIVTKTPEKLVKRVASRRSGLLLGFHFTSQREQVKDFDGPIQAWYLTSTVSGASGMQLVDFPHANTTDGRIGSRLSAPVSSVFANVLIVADADQVTGQPIGAVADYIAMLALSQAKTLESCEKLPSILDLMAQDCGDRQKPRKLTSSDLAYLKAVYAADNTWPASFEESHVSNRMKAELRVSESAYPRDLPEAEVPLAVSRESYTALNGIHANIRRVYASQMHQCRPPLLRACEYGL